MSRKLADINSVEYRLSIGGPNALALTELLGIIIGGDKGQESAVYLMKQFGDMNKLMNSTVTEISSMASGIGIVTAQKILAALGLARHLLEKQDKPTAIHSPEDAYKAMAPFFVGYDSEQFHVLILDTRNHPVGYDELYSGTVSSSNIRVSEVFRKAIRLNASAIVVAHNHPSGDPTPSPDDVAVTKAIAQAGKLLDIELLDHIIIVPGKYVSMKDRGLGFS